MLSEYDRAVTEELGSMSKRAPEDKVTGVEDEEEKVEERDEKVGLDLLEVNKSQLMRVKGQNYIQDKTRVRA